MHKCDLSGWLWALMCRGAPERGLIWWAPGNIFLEFWQNIRPWVVPASSVVHRRRARRPPRPVSLSLSDDALRQMAAPYAFVTLITSDSYLPGALALAAALKDLHPSPPTPPEV